MGTPLFGELELNVYGDVALSDDSDSDCVSDSVTSSQSGFAGKQIVLASTASNRRSTWYDGTLTYRVTSDAMKERCRFSK